MWFLVYFVVAIFVFGVLIALDDEDFNGLEFFGALFWPVTIIMFLGYKLGVYLKKYL